MTCNPEAEAPVTVAVETALTKPNEAHALCKFAVNNPEEAACVKVAEAALKKMAGLLVCTVIDKALVAENRAASFNPYTCDETNVVPK